MRHHLLGGLMGILVLSGCGSGSGGGNPVVPPPVGTETCPKPLDVALDAPTFSAHVLPALRAGCGSSTTACHGGAAPAGHVSWADSRAAAAVLADLVDVAPSNAPSGYARIKPRQPEASWLLVKVTQDCPGGTGGNCYGHRMPLGSTNLCTTAVDNLRRWVQSGAPL